MDMTAQSICLWLIFMVGLSQAAPQDSSSSTFQSQTSLVLVPFNVVRDKVFVPDLKSSDVVLLEDGHPRSFTAFEGPATGRRIPLELLLLFDTTTLPPSKPTNMIGTHWNREATYAFTKQWDEAMSKAILDQPGADVRVSIYHFDNDQLECLSRSTKDPLELLAAFRRLLTPISDSDTIPIALPPNRKDRSGPKDVFVGSRGWLMESVIGTLKHAAAVQENAMRMLVVFSEGFTGTTTIPQDAVDHANALGIPLFPVILDYDLYIQHPFVYEGPGIGVPVPDFRAPNDPSRQLSTRVPPMDKFGSLGDLTGGGSFYPSSITPKVISEIVESVRNQGLTQYVVGFVPGTGKPKEHRLEIRLKSKSLGKVSWGQRRATY
ncbi:MAG: hypothetical protein ACRD4E_03225 [Bryobacteraceae bacterium]